MRRRVYDFRSGELVDVEELGDQGDDDAAGDAAPAGRVRGPVAPRLEELRCRRCGYLVVPAERLEGHMCKRRTSDPAGWAARARAQIRPVVGGVGSSGEARVSEQGEGSANG